MSEVLEATSRTSWAPIFSYGSSSSISFATFTPSFDIIGLAGSEGDDFTLLRFFLGGIGNNDAAFFDFLLFDRLHEHPVSERFYVYCCHSCFSFTPFAWWCCCRN